MKKLITLFLFTSFWGNISFSQVITPANPKLREPGSTTQITGGVAMLPTDQILKKPGHYTTEQWHELVDTFWGPGVSTATKLKLFDDFWNKVDQSYGGFPNLYVNWDSLRTVYRPIVEAGVSRGRFAGILSSLTRALQDVHDGIMDLGIDSTLSYFYLYSDVNEYPNFPSFYYRPGIPIINISELTFRTNFGAGLTLLPDSSILVYSVMLNHPLSLQPGDIILGYDGIPWKEEFKDLLSAELPIFSGLFGTSLGTTTDAANQVAMEVAGLNWGLFDTIDVVKYSTNDTLHFPTSLLAAITPPYFIATQQLPVKGVQFPDIQGNKRVSWGIIEGTNIGYIYVWDWTESSTIPFGQAVDELMHIQKVSGLIMDFRKNAGGAGSADQGFKHLFNSDPTSNLSGATRLKGDDHYAFNIYSGSAFGQMITTSEIFDHPIAVLLGPACGSTGDWWAFMLRFHPMVRFFGKPTNGAYRYSNVDFVNTTPTYPYYQHIDDGSLYSNVNNEGYMIHKSFPVDEEVWLTRDGVASGEDEVANSALDWIQNLSHAHDVTVQPVYSGPENEEITLTAKVENPNNHELSVYAKITGLNKVPVDSILLFDDGGHGDGDSGDGLWGASWPMPSGEKTYVVNLTTEDAAAGCLRTLPSVVRYTSVGPLVYDGITYTGSDTIPNPGNNIRFKVTLKNNGLTESAVKVKAIVTSLDTIASVADNINNWSFANIAPGKLSTSSVSYKIAISQDCPVGKEIPVRLDISSDNYTFWSDTFLISVSTGVTDEIMEPITRIYPNPTENIFTVELNNAVSQLLEIEVFTVTGEMIYQKGFRNRAAHFVEQVDLSGYAKGIYLVKVKQERKVTVGKVVVR